jgi:hypothetical protein
MQTANAKRIAWFIQLKRILRFQKYHFAPHYAPVRRQELGKDNVTGSNSGSFAFLQAPSANSVSAPFRSAVSPFAAAFSPISTLGPHEFRTSNEPTKSPSLLTARMIALAKPNLVRHAQIHDGSLVALPFVRALGTHKARIQSGRTPGSRHPNALTQQHPRSDSSNSPTSPERPPVGGITFLPQVRDVRASNLSVARSFFADTRVDGSLRARPPPPEEQSDPNRFAEMSAATRLASPRPTAQQTGPDGLEGTSGYQPQQRKKSSAITIHLDGSVLGRWAVQHMERALGKPATGMTGVDPRANPPRNRVSPF